MNEIRPIGHRAGNNKYGFIRCPMCGVGPERNDQPNYTNGNFMFRDGPSATEYRISALCQDCQDGLFGEGDQ